MLKKIAIAFAASAFALTLAVPAASACGGMKGKTAHEKKQDKDGVIAKKDKAKEADKAKETKDDAKKKPSKVSSKS